jgi:hypothetical protein
VRKSRKRSLEGRFCRFPVHGNLAVLGRPPLAAELGSTEQRVRTALKFLEKHEIINQQPTNKYTIISLINWHKYQNEQPAINQLPNQQLTSKRPAKGQQIHHSFTCKFR